MPPDIGGTLGKSDNKWEDIHVDKINGVSIAESGTSTTSAAGLVELATDAEVQAGDDATRAVTSAGLKTYTEWRPSGMKNLIINGNFDIWQRGDGPFTSQSGNWTPHADRWGTRSNAVNTQSISRQEFSAFQTNVPGYPKNFLRLEVSAQGVDSIVISTQIEDARRLYNRPLTLSFWAKGDKAVEFYPQINIDFKTPAVWQTAVQRFTTTEWQKFTWTFTPSSQSTATDFGAGNYMEVQLNFPEVAAAQAPFVFDIAQAQLELGSIATPFEQRPIGLELALCQRYYQKRAMYVGATPSSMRIDMRAAPTITGGGTGFSSTSTTADTLICSQTTGAVETLEMAAEL